MSELAERLKRGWHGMAVITLGGVRHLEICLEAADRIEALEAENEQLKIGKIASLARKVDELQARLDGREHIDTKDCWCHPTMESYENGDLIIHHKPN